MECPEGTIKSLKKFFDAEGYHTLLLQEDMIDIEAIPIQEYRKRGVSWSQTLYTAYRIYRSDIMFLDIQLERKDIASAVMLSLKMIRFIPNKLLKETLIFCIVYSLKMH